MKLETKSMFRRTLYIFSFLFLFLYSFVSGQNTAYKAFANISLSTEASVINCFLQDRQGLIWIGSDKGLFSYDGYTVQQHFTPGEQSNSHIYCGVIVDSAYLYFGTDNGLLVYNYLTDRYEKTKVTFPSDIRALAIDGNTLWLGTLNGLYAYDFDSQKLKRFTVEEYKNIPHETIYSIICAHNGKIYIGTYNGFCSYEPETNSFEKIDLPVSAHKSNQFVNSLLEDTLRNCIWIGTEGNLFKYYPQTGKVEQIDTFHDNSVKSLTLDAYGYLLAGTDNGLYVYHESEPVLHVLHDSRNRQSLSNNIIWCVFTDNEKNIWMGTDYGISLSRHNDHFRYIPISQLTGTGDGNHFYSLYKDSRGIFWFGGTNGLIRFNEHQGNYSNIGWFRMGNSEYPLPHNRIRQVYEDRERQLWIASDGGVNRYDYDTEKFIHYSITDSTGTYNSNWVYSIFEDNEGKLWIGTCLGGIFIVDRQKLIGTKTGNFIAEYNFTTRNGLSDMFVNQIIPDKAGNVWVLLYNNGINRINTSTREVTRIPVDKWTNEKNVSFMLCDTEGNVWIGFRGGVVRVIPGTNQSKVMHLDDFSNSDVLFMTEAGEYIWVSTTDGVWVIDKQRLESKRLNSTDKVFTNLFYDSAGNRIYMGGMDGFAVISPEIVDVDILDSPIYLTALYVNNHSYIPNYKSNSRSIRYSDTIILDHKQNNLSFEFSDFPYALEEKNKFVYKLNGLDNGWNLLKQDNNRITYTNLDYGKYQLVINKLDLHGKPSGNQYTLSIHIRPPWYYTTWAKSLYFILFVSLIAWTINFFRIKNRLKFEQMEKERILEQSRSKIDFFTKISLDFKTPLSMIIAPVSKLLLEVKNQTEKKQLEVISRNAMKINSLIHQVLDFDRIDNDTNSFLIFSQVEFVSFAKSLFEVFEEEATKEKKLAFDFHSNATKLYTNIDVVKFESVLNNLFSNAFKYTQAGGKISLSINAKSESGALEIMVSDTGTGISPQDIPYIFQRFYQSSDAAGKHEGTGMGLYLVKTYTELHGGRVEIISEENKGTNVIITLPNLIIDAETTAWMDAIPTPKIIEAVSYDEKFLSNVTKIIENHVSDSELNVNALSELSGFNVKHIYRKIKLLTGMTPVDYIKSIRMKKAAVLFSQKKFTVAEVMYMVGFSNHSYFSKCFQTKFGKTPKQFMEEPYPTI